MITWRKAKALLAPGDTIFSTDGKRIVECVVQKICADSVLTDKDVFFLTNMDIPGGLPGMV